MNVLLLFVPAGISLNAVSVPVIAVLVVNFLAVVGLLSLGDAILRCITSKIGTRFAFLLYISVRYVSTKFHASVTLTLLSSNLMQAISSIVLLVKREIVTMQMSLLGTLQVNILLLPALSVFYATLRQKSMVHEYAATKKYIMLLFLATSGFIVPTVFDNQTDLPTSSTAALSRGSSILLMFTYGAYLFFQLSTHKTLFERDQSVKQCPTQRSDTDEWII